MAGHQVIVCPERRGGENILVFAMKQKIWLCGDCSSDGRAGGSICLRAPVSVGKILTPTCSLMLLSEYACV